MPGRCTICYSPSRASIEADLLNEVPYREIARRYGVGRGAVSNHHKNHMEGPPGKYGPYEPPTEPAPSLDDVKAVLEAAQAPQDAQDGLADENPITMIKGLLRELKSLQSQAKGRSVDIQLRVVREMRPTIETLAKLVGDLESAPQINIMLHPQFQQAAIVISDALKDHPEALAAVTDGLLEFGGTGLEDEL